MNSFVSVTLSFALVATFVNGPDLVVATDPKIAESEASGSNIKQPSMGIEGGNQLIGVALWFMSFPEIVIIGETGMFKAHPDRSVCGWFARVHTHIGESTCLLMHLLYNLSLVGRTHGSQNAAIGSEHNGLEKVKVIERGISTLPRVPKSKLFGGDALIGAFLNG